MADAPVGVAVSTGRGRWFAPAAVAAIVFFLSGCTQVLVGDPQGDSGDDDLFWSAIHAVDLSEIDSALVSAECTGFRTFEDFELASDASRAVLGASLCEVYDLAGVPSFAARPWGRIYAPVSAGGSGWSEVGRDHAVLSEGAASDRYRDLAVAISPEGEAAIVAWDFDPASEVSVSGVWGPTSGWTRLGTNPLAGLTSFSFFEVEVTASGAWADPSPEKQSRDGPLDFVAGREKSLVWNTEGKLRLLGLDGASLVVRTSERSSDDDAWEFEGQDFGAVGSLDAGQVEWIDDGIRTIALWSPVDPDAFSTSIAGSLYFALEDNGFQDIDCSPMTTTCAADDLAAGGDGTNAADVNQALNPLVSGATLAFGAATDSQGTTVVAYLSEHSDELSATCSTLAQGCNHRLYASVRTPDGIWVGPTPLDEGFTLLRATTTYLQDSGTYLDDDMDGTVEFTPVEGGLVAMEPQVGYLGEGRFVVIWAISDYTTASAPFTQLYARGYMVGGGWDSPDETVEIGEPFLHSSKADGSFGTYRPINRIKLATDPDSGRAILVTQETEALETDPGAIDDRHYIHAVYRYDRESGWTSKKTFEDEIPCPLLHLPDEDDLSTPYLSACGSAPIEASIFGSGEAVVVFPMPRQEVETKAELGLHSVEFAP